MLPRSFVEIQNQILSAAIALTGTPFSLHYSSDRVRGRQTAYTLDIPLSRETLPPELKRIILEIEIAGRQIQEIFAPEPEQSYTFVWDGCDEQGNPLLGKHPVKVRTNYIYRSPKLPRVKEKSSLLGVWAAKTLGLGGWSLSVCHAYDPIGKVLYLGNGRRRSNLEAQGTDILTLPSEGGGLLYYFDRQGRHLKTVNTLTRSVLHAFEYNDSGLLCTVRDGDGQHVSIERDGDGNLTAIVSPYGQRTQLCLSDRGYLQSASNPAGEGAVFEYAGEGLLVGYTDPKGNIYRCEYDDLGYLTSYSEPDGSFSLFVRTRTEQGFKVARITATGRESTYITERLATGENRQINQGCGGAGAIVALTDKEGKETITYPDGSVLIEETQTDPRFETSVALPKRTILKTPSGRLAELLVNRSVELSNPEDPLSLTKLTDTVHFNGGTSITTFDAQQKQIVRTSPEGRQSILSLDEKGRVIQSEIPGLEPVYFAYDTAGHLLTAKQGDKTVLSYRYNKEGHLSSLCNAEGNEIQYRYDEVGRIVQTTLPSGKIHQFSYDANGNLTQIIVPSGAIHNLSYTVTNLEAGYTPPDNPAYANTYDKEQGLTRSTLPSDRAIEGTYNQFGYLQQTSYSEASIDVSYEEQSQRVKSLLRTPIEGDNKQELSFVYDGGLVKEIAWNGVANGRYRYRYDDNFTLVGMQLDDESEVEMKRDKDGLLTQYGNFTILRDKVTGAPKQMSDDNLKIDVKYDKAGRTISRTHTVKGKEIYRLGLVYDKLSRIIQKQETISGELHTYDYTYDLDGQLIVVHRDGEIAERYVYDDNGNRIEWQLETEQHTASYNSQDCLIEADDVPYEFDADGFLMRRGDVMFKYSALGELLEVVFPDEKRITYTYDSMNRRVARTDNSGTYQYLYGNLNHLFQITAIRNPSGKLMMYYYDPSGKLFACSIGKILHYIITDHLGSPRLLVDNEGINLNTIDYQNFGLQVTTSDISIGFAGGLADFQTQLVRFGLRDYDPVTGKWTAKDPIGFVGGDANLYRYVHNSPISLIDPTGRAECFYDISDAKLTCKSNSGETTVTISGGKVFSGHKEKNYQNKIDRINESYGPIQPDTYDLLHSNNFEGSYFLDPGPVDRGMYKLFGDRFESIRGEFMLHYGKTSHGCITVTDKSAWEQVKKLLNGDIKDGNAGTLKVVK